MQAKKLCCCYNHKEQTIFCRGRVGLSASAVELNEEVLRILSEVLSVPFPQDTTESALYRKPWITDTALQNSNNSKSKPSASTEMLLLGELQACQSEKIRWSYTNALITIHQNFSAWLGKTEEW